MRAGARRGGHAKAQEDAEINGDMRKRLHDAGKMASGLDSRLCSWAAKAPPAVVFLESASSKHHKAFRGTCGVVSAKVTHVGAPSQGARLRSRRSGGEPRGVRALVGSHVRRPAADLILLRLDPPGPRGVIVRRCAVLQRLVASLGPAVSCEDEVRAGLLVVAAPARSRARGPAGKSLPDQSLGMAPVKAHRTRQFSETRWPSEGQKRTLCPTGTQRERFPAGPLGHKMEGLARWRPLAKRRGSSDWRSRLTDKRSALRLWLPGRRGLAGPSHPGVNKAAKLVEQRHHHLSLPTDDDLVRQVIHHPTAGPGVEPEQGVGEATQAAQRAAAWISRLGALRAWR